MILTINDKRWYDLCGRCGHVRQNHILWSREKDLFSDQDYCFNCKYIKSEKEQENMCMAFYTFEDMIREVTLNVI